MQCLNKDFICNYFSLIGRDIVDVKIKYNNLKIRNGNNGQINMKDVVKGKPIPIEIDTNKLTFYRNNQNEYNLINTINHELTHACDIYDILNKFDNIRSGEDLLNEKYCGIFHLWTEFNAAHVSFKLSLKNENHIDELNAKDCLEYYSNDFVKNYNAENTIYDKIYVLMQFFGIAYSIEFFCDLSSDCKLFNKYPEIMEAFNLLKNNNSLDFILDKVDELDIIISRIQCNLYL